MTPLTEEQLVKRAEELAREVVLRPIIEHERKFDREPDERLLQYALAMEDDAFQVLKTATLLRLREHQESLRLLIQVRQWYAGTGIGICQEIDAHIKTISDGLGLDN